MNDQAPPKNTDLNAPAPGSTSTVEPPSTTLVGRPGARDLSLDIYPPGPDSLRTAVILLHGGGWMFGDRKDMADYARHLAAHGFVAIAAEYRLLGEAAWPAQIEDVKDVVAWVDQHAADLGIVAGKVGLMGMSAGGQLALLAAGTQVDDPFGRRTAAAGKIAAVVSAFAPSVLHLPKPGGPMTPVAALLGPDASEAKAKAASPLTYVKSGFPPTCLFSGTADAMVPHAATLSLFAALEAAGVPTDLHLYHGHTHEFTRLPSMLGPVMDEVALFLKRAIVDPAGYAQENQTLNPFMQPGFPPRLPPLPQTGH